MKLIASGCNLTKLGDHIFVSFPVRPLVGAKVIWMNERWMIESGMDPLDSKCYSDFELKLLNYFGVSSTFFATDNAKSKSSYLFADRYGATGGSIHGGSGRCGVRDGFIAKGIGKTPLVNERADPHHKDGLMSLSESLKETMFSEITGRELPWGAIPVVAVIDAGFDYLCPEGRESRRAAILIRPTFVRPAHFERSIFFGKGGQVQSEQFQDALKVKEAISVATKDPARYPSVEEMFHRFAEQLGASRALRFWQGKFLTSNISIDGSIVDFGAFRAVPNWRAAEGLAGEVFGAEIIQLRNSFLSVSSYFVKYSTEHLQNGDIRSHLAKLTLIENNSFTETCLAALGVDNNDSFLRAELACLLTRYFNAQQKKRVETLSAGRCSWIHDLFSPRSKGEAASGEEIALMHSISDILDKSGRNPLRNLNPASKVMHFFNSRTSLGFSTVKRKTRCIERLICRKPTEAKTIFATFINRQIKENTLWYRFVPNQLHILSVEANLYSAIFLCKELTTNSLIFWICSSCNDESIYFFGQKIPIDTIKSKPALISTHCIGFSIPLSAYQDCHISIGSCLFPFEFEIFLQEAK
jgi:hypothetical protein